MVTARDGKEFGVIPGWLPHVVRKKSIQNV
jgi:hypothetical protein